MKIDPRMELQVVPAEMGRGAGPQRAFSVIPGSTRCQFNYPVRRDFCMKQGYFSKA